MGNSFGLAQYAQCMDWMTPSKVLELCLQAAHLLHVLLATAPRLVIVSRSNVGGDSLCWALAGLQGLSAASCMHADTMQTPLCRLPLQLWVHASPASLKQPNQQNFFQTAPAALAGSGCACVPQLLDQSSASTNDSTQMGCRRVLRMPVHFIASCCAAGMARAAALPKTMPHYRASLQLAKGPPDPAGRMRAGMLHQWQAALLQCNSASSTIPAGQRWEVWSQGG